MGSAWRHEPQKLCSHECPTTLGQSACNSLGGHSPAVTFYRQMGLVFDLHAHGKGLSTMRPVVVSCSKSIHNTTSKIRLGFRVDDVGASIRLLREICATTLTEPEDGDWGRRVVLRNSTNIRSSDAMLGFEDEGEVGNLKSDCSFQDTARKFRSRSKPFSVRKLSG